MLKDLLKRLLQFPTQLFLLAVGALLFLPMLGNVHLFDWDEINFAESAREMLSTGVWRHVQINFQPFYEKPPLFIWMQALCMQRYGVSEFAARLPNAICGIITLLVVFNVGRRLFNSRFGILWSLLFAASFLPHLYFKSGIIDPFFNLFIFLGIYFTFRITVINDFDDRRSRARQRRWHLFLSALFIGLAVLTKGPVAILLFILTTTVAFVFNRGKMKIEISEIVKWWVAVVTIILIWLSFEWRANGWKFWDEFIQYQLRLLHTEDSGHGGFFGYHFIVLLLGCFPASALIFTSFRNKNNDDDFQDGFRKWMIILMGVVLVLFSVVQTKIVHYSSLCYFPITFLAAYALNSFIEGKRVWTWRQTFPLLLIGGLWSVVAMAIPRLLMAPDELAVFIKSEFGKQALTATVFWSPKEIAYGIGYFATLSIAVFLIVRSHLRWGIYLLLISSTLFIETMLVSFVPRIERYSQNAYIEFLEQKQNEDCYVEVAGFKSYAHLFYKRKQASDTLSSNVLFWGKTTKPVYIVTRADRADIIRWVPDAKELYRKNGFVFSRRN